MAIMHHRAWTDDAIHPTSTLLDPSVVDHDEHHLTPSAVQL